LVASSDTNELASAIHRLVDNSELRQAFGKNATIAAKKINWEEQEGKLVSLYRDVLERRH
jgi:glycosyltransferase involved in cell wall biosynthesis